MYIKDPPWLTPPQLKRTQENGGWLNIRPSIDNGTFLTKGGFFDALRMRYGLSPNKINTICNGRGDPFTIDHIINWRGGIIIQRHDEVKISILTDDLSPKAVHDEPEIYPFLDGNGIKKADIGDISETGF